jgi:hypothetical protein
VERCLACWRDQSDKQTAACDRSMCSNYQPLSTLVVLLFDFCGLFSASPRAGRPTDTFFIAEGGQASQSVARLSGLQVVWR